MILLLRTHAGLMILAICFMLVGFIVARFMKKRTWWFKVHRSLGITGAILVLLGLFAEALQLSLTGRPHFTVPHSWIGIVAVSLALLTPILGLIQVRARKVSSRLRGLHRWSGRFTLLLMFINIFLGLYMIGVI